MHVSCCGSCAIIPTRMLVKAESFVQYILRSLRVRSNCCYPQRLDGGRMETLGTGTKVAS
eukprot:2278417-Amphidinium_carterae.1